MKPSTQQSHFEVRRGGSWYAHDADTGHVSPCRWPCHTAAHGGPDRAVADALPSGERGARRRPGGAGRGRIGWIARTGPAACGVCASVVAIGSRFQSRSCQLAYGLSSADTAQARSDARPDVGTGDQPRRHSPSSVRIGRADVCEIQTAGWRESHKHPVPEASGADLRRVAGRTRDTRILVPSPSVKDLLSEAAASLGQTRS